MFTEYDPEAICCMCGKVGAWPINGYYYCEYCVDEIDEDEFDEEIDIFNGRRV